MYIGTLSKAEAHVPILGNSIISFTNMLYNYKVPLDTLEHNVDYENELLKITKKTRKIYKQNTQKRILKIYLV